MISFNRAVLKGKLKTFFLLLLLVSGVFCFGGSGKAQQNPAIATAVQVSPVRFDWDINNGEERTGIINLKNYSTEPYDVEAQMEDFFVTDDTTEARFFIPNEQHPLFAYDVINWVEMLPNITLAPGEGKDIYFKLKVPEQSPTGGYYGAFFFKTSKHKDESGTEETAKVIINQRVGVLLVLAVKGSEPIRRSGDLQKFVPTQKVFWGNSAKLEADVINGGNIHYKALGFLDIYKFGEKIDSVKIDPRMIYPGKFRKYETKWTFSPWAYGYYKAKFSLFSEDQQIRIEGETAFWVIPWKTTVAIIILIFIIWMIYKIFDSRFEIRKKGGDDADSDMGHGTGDMGQETGGKRQETSDMGHETGDMGQATRDMSRVAEHMSQNNFQAEKREEKRRIV